MATYKVPQDVEADDKLLGPFTFRQFIYLIAVALAGLGAWGLFQISPVLVVIPLPVIVFFGALALPLKKDQPMEVYLAAIVSFYLKPRRRFWDSDGIESLIEITVPKSVEPVRLTKDLSQSEADRRFGYLAEIVDSEGWAIRGQGVQSPDTAMNTDAYYAAQQAEDMLDSNYGVAQSLDYMIGQSDAKRREELIEKMKNIPTQEAQVTEPQAEVATGDPVDAPAPIGIEATPSASVGNVSAFNFFASSNTRPGTLDTSSNNPYSSGMQQKVIQPLGSSLNTSGNSLSADIINLANDAELSIQTIGREANRINQRDNLSDGAVVPLR